ncbi:MAG: UDP-3-O-(3-hydroxymyristoyl)glucosamine N-acyltransferase [Saprospiraceae bacterium]|nr:UDP-3-O-(3-hydroxymyristoyl)glucosamine N-acyltransferase [Saprospiraceae bacterium]
MQITAQQIAHIVNGSIIGNPEIPITGPSKIEEGTKGTITFLANPKYKDYLYTTEASIVLISSDFIPEDPVLPTLIVVGNVYQALAILMEKFNSGISLLSGIAPTAVVASSAEIGENTSIDDLVIIKPGVKIGTHSKVYGQVFIGDNVTIGNHVTLFPGVKIYHNCVIGDRCIIHANTVIGSDGFGFARDEEGNYKKIPQTGNVVLENDVEVGSNTVIDRASMGSTVIKSGAKLDNLIQIAHNVSIGNHTAIAAQTGVAGSVSIGSSCIIGGQVGIAGHLSIADGTMIQAQSGISSTIKGPNAKLYGSPAIDYQNYLKSYAYFRKFPDIVQQLRHLQSTMDKLSQNNK